MVHIILFIPFDSVSVYPRLQLRILISSRKIVFCKKKEPEAPTSGSIGEFRKQPEPETAMLF